MNPMAPNVLLPMPATITLRGNRRIRLDFVRGTVIETSESLMAVAHPGGNPRRLVGGTPFVRQGRLRHDVMVLRQVWIRTDAGQEAAHDLTHFPVAVRVGHELMLVSGAAAGVAEGAFFGALNLTTGESAFDESIDRDRLRPLGLDLPRRFYRRRAPWGVALGVATGVAIGIACAVGGAQDRAFIVAGALVGFLLAWPVIWVQGRIKQIEGQRLVPQLNLTALTHFIANS